MNKAIIIIGLCLLSTTLFSQKFITQTGTITFFSEARLENIEAVNNQVSSVLNAGNGELAFSLLMKAFTFEKALMQEHFNEKYVESPKYPKATFKGKLTDFDISALTESAQTYSVQGELTMHGKTVKVESTALLKRTTTGVHGTCTFTVLLADFDIKIPSAVADNLSNTIEIQVDVSYEPL